MHQSSRASSANSHTSNRKNPVQSQHDDILRSFGTSEERLQRAIAALQNGSGVLIVDDADRENEGDLIFPAHSITEQQMALLIRHCSGIVCLCLTEEHADRLSLPPMCAQNTNTQQTAFTISIEAATGVTTGVSAADRVQTIRTAVASNASPANLRRPGHIFPLRAKPQGVLERRGHTEATVDIMRLAGLPSHGVLCELTNDDGTMARLPEIALFARQHDFPLLSVEDIVHWRQQHDAS